MLTTVKTKMSNLRSQMTANAYKLLYMLPVFSLLGMSSASADTTIGGTAPTVDSDGKVTLAGGNGDAKDGVASLMSNGQFWIGVVAGVAGLALIGYGIWYGFKAGRAIQAGNADGYPAAGKVVTGTIVGGVLLAIPGAILAIAAATGNNFFG